MKQSSPRFDRVWVSLITAKYHAELHLIERFCRELEAEIVTDGPWVEVEAAMEVLGHLQKLWTEIEGRMGF